MMPLTSLPHFQDDAISPFEVHGSEGDTYEEQITEKTLVLTGHQEMGMWDAWDALFSQGQNSFWGSYLCSNQAEHFLVICVHV